jgi:hypothetical protein
MRREGLYSSLLSAWRCQRDGGELSARRPKKRGTPAQVPDASARRVAEPWAGAQAQSSQSL